MVMAMNIAANSTAVENALRALQLIFAIVTMGTVGYTIHGYRGYTVFEPVEFGGFLAHSGVPGTWGFMMFCAAWTVLGNVFLLVAGTKFADYVSVGYVRVAVEAVAFLSWLAGFIAVAVDVGISSACRQQADNCGALTAATVFGALEWLLFAMSIILTVNVVFEGGRRVRTGTAMPPAPAYSLHGISTSEEKLRS